MSINTLLLSGDVEKGRTGGYQSVPGDNSNSNSSSSTNETGSKWWKVSTGVLLVTTAVLAVLLAVGASTWTPPPASSDDDTATGTDYSMLNGFCADVPAITAGEYASRQAGIAAYLAATGADLFVAEPGATMLWATAVAWKTSERPFLLAVNRTGGVFWVAPKFEEGSAREDVGAQADIVLWQEDQSPYALLYQTVGAPLAGYTVVVEPEMRTFISAGLRAAFPVGNNQTVGLSLIQAVRAVKSPAEIAILRCANEATKAAVQQVVAQYVATGVSEDAVHAELVKAQEAAGLAAIWSLVLIGPNAAYPHGTVNRIPLADGLLVLIDTGGELDGYQSDISRTFSWPYGVYSPDQLYWWDTVHLAQEAALAAIQPGVPAGDVDAAARAVVEQRGFGSDYGNFTHRLGHGIGMQGHEEVYMVRGNSYPMTAGLCFSVEPGVYLPGIGGVRIEDIVCATDDGYELFGPMSLTLDDPLDIIQDGIARNHW